MQSNSLGLSEVTLIYTVVNKTEISVYVVDSCDEYLCLLQEEK